MNRVFASSIMLLFITSFVNANDFKSALSNLNYVCEEGKPVPESKREPSPVIEQKMSNEVVNSTLKHWMTSPKHIHECVSAETKKYSDKVIAYCQKYNLAACVGGGCYHNVVIPIEVTIAALKVCEKAS